jgi:hypothetical protein
MNGSGFNKLTQFLCQLEAQKVQYLLAHYRDEAVMVMVATPSERWEVDFFADGSVEVERFVSRGGVLGESVLSELFAAYADEPLVPA